MSNIHNAVDNTQNTQLNSMLFNNMDLNNLTPEQLRSVRKLLTPKMNKYIPVMPTAKQTAFLLMNDVKEILFGGKQVLPLGVNP